MQVSKNILQKLIGEKLSNNEIEKAYNLHAFEVEEVEQVLGDTVFDIDVLPNRSSDSLSWRGLAFELGAILNKSLKQDPLLESYEKRNEILSQKSDKLSVAVEDKEYCNIYATALIEGVEVQESPDWLKNELEKMGQKSINNIVDATNYVMFMLGQPMHAFDASKLENKDGYKIGVRKAKAGEKFISLDNNEYELDESISVIFDGNSEKREILGLAGIKGGKNSGVDENTKTIILESARFNPTLARIASQKLKLRTDASKRFENDIPDELPESALVFALEIIKEVAGGNFKGVSVFAGDKRENPKIFIDTEQINTLLGLDLQEKEIHSILNRLGFSISGNEVQAPFWRTDINIWQDVAEEVMRLYGFDNLSSREISKEKINDSILKNYFVSELLREFFIENAFIELTNSSLEDQGELKLKNALASDKSFFRESIAYSLKKALDKNEPNAPLFGIYDSFKVFEIGSVYKNGKEALHTAVAVRPVAKKKREQKTQDALAEIKRKLEDRFAVSLPEPEGEVLEFDLQEVFADFKVEGDYPKLPVLPNIQFKPFSQFPFVLRDIAVWIPNDKNKTDIEEVIKKHSGDLLKRFDLFDVFEKDEKTSYAYHLVFQSDSKTLTDEEVNEIMKKIESELNSKKGFKVR